MSTIKGLFNAVLASADGGERLLFHCPGCGYAHGPAIGPGPGPRWSFNGDYVKPVFTPSLLVTHKQWTPRGAPENEGRWVDHVCHSFIGNSGAQPGQIIFLSDCTHALAGQVADIPQWVMWDDEDDREERAARPRVMTRDQVRIARRLLAVKIAERRRRLG